ncbi:helix-turn-helix domain-containing protein [Neptuniibacter sp. QD37_11]|uniref:helix-turn-helix domain-containing protein n=1 Tax=Neptuniibacter sp. QD37_11 TaxID=3398209 RepID=UPI0039F498E7
MGRVKIGKLLAAKRKELKMGQKDASERTGLDVSVISKIETGKFRGSIRILEAYLEILGFELSIQPKVHVLPDFDDIEELFKDD